MKVQLPKKPRVVQISKTAQGKIRKAAEYLLNKYNSISNPLLRIMLPREAALLLPDEVYLELAHFKLKLICDTSIVVLLSIIIN